MLGAARRAAQAVASNARKFHSSQALKEDYIHAPSMYNITAMKNRKLKFGLAVGGVVVGGCAIPWIACEWQFKKARG